MFKKKLEKKFHRGIAEQCGEKSSKPELTTLLQDLQKEVNRLQEEITTRLPTDMAVTDPTDQIKLVPDYLNTLEKPGCFQEQSCRVRNQVEDCCFRENDPESLSAAGSSTTFWSAESLLVENVMAMATECGHLFCESCIKDVCFCAGAEALCPRCGKKVGVLREIYF